MEAAARELATPRVQRQRAPQPNTSPFKEGTALAALAEAEGLDPGLGPLGEEPGDARRDDLAVHSDRVGDDWQPGRQATTPVRTPETMGERPLLRAEG